MVDLIRAEWRKASRNRWLTGFLIWIFPVGAVVVSVLLLISSLASEAVRQQALAQPLDVAEQAIAAVGLLNNQFGRIFFIAFAVVMFAGEYAWGTIKDLVPRSQRWRIVIAKLTTLGLYVMAAMVSMSVLWVTGRLLIAAIIGVEIVWFSAGFLPFIGTYLLQLVVTFVAVLFVAALAGLVAMAIRSIIGGMMIGIGLTFAEPTYIVISVLGALWLDTAWTLQITRLTPMFNLDNITSWLRYDSPTNLIRNVLPSSAPEKFDVVNSLPLSILIMAVWIALVVGLLLYLFNRQDITT